MAWNNKPATSPPSVVHGGQYGTIYSTHAEKLRKVYADEYILGVHPETACATFAFWILWAHVFLASELCVSAVFARYDEYPVQLILLQYHDVILQEWKMAHTEYAHSVTTRRNASRILCLDCGSVYGYL